MPNWCENDLVVEGPSALVEDFMRFAAGPEGPFDFDRFVPYPEEFRLADAAADAWERGNADRPDVNWADCPPDGFDAGGCDWCVENWGTKWNAVGTRVEGPAEGDEDGTDRVMYHFDTPWTPPIPLVRKAAHFFPGLAFELRYFERGRGFNGILRCEGGEFVRDEVGPYFGDRGG